MASEAANTNLNTKLTRTPATTASVLIVQSKFENAMTEVGVLVRHNAQIENADADFLHRSSGEENNQNNVKSNNTTASSKQKQHSRACVRVRRPGGTRKHDRGSERNKRQRLSRKHETNGSVYREQVEKFECFTTHYQIAACSFAKQQTDIQGTATANSAQKPSNFVPTHTLSVTSCSSVCMRMAGCAGTS